MQKKLKRIFFILLFAVILLNWILLYLLQAKREETPDHQALKIQEELEFFPIPQSAKDKTLSYDYVDSWMTERTFGGDRHHEGCDIMMSENTRGIYPVVSMTDGVLEAIGWLKLGGYRLGIRSESGTYYYYAHMESYGEDLKQGMSVKAGEFLGFVGDTGYGSEGTTGQFAVHLHVGIYVPDENKKDTAVNPYPYLRNLETRHVLADFYKPERKQTDENDADR